MTEQILGYSELGGLTGRSAAQIEKALHGFTFPPLRFRELTVDETARIAFEVEGTIRESNLRRSGSDDPDVWIRGWGEIAGHLKNRKITIDSLRPQYFRGEPICRLFGRYVRPVAPDFEYYAGLALRRIIFDEFLNSASTIGEFGCGTGINLLLLAEQFPSARLIGTDWAPICKEILAQMARQTGHDIKGGVFNMLSATGWPDSSADSEIAFLTVHAMEQLGTGWQPFADFLMARRPQLCLHIEPLFELYNDHSAFDDRARRYHLRRRYLRGFHPYVLHLCASGSGELLASRRIEFGGLYHEAYSVLAWRPRPT